VLVKEEPGEGAALVCPLCSSEDSIPRFERDGYTFRDCDRCRTLFVGVAPSQEELRRLYTEYAPERGSTLCWDVRSRHDTTSFIRVLDSALESVGYGPVLDIGCGTGAFLSCARQRSWTDLTGLEISSRAAAEARSVSGAVVSETTFDDATLPHDHYAVVGLWDVLEHLRSPADALRRVRQVLLPGGIVAISTPNRFGLSVSLFGRQSVVACPPEHLLIASRQGLRLALTAAGLSAEGIWSEDVRVREWTRWPDAPTPTPMQRQRYCWIQDRITGARWFGTARSIANVLLRTMRIGDQLLVIAKRPRG
jgi:SAM-dependent methyltransferase